MNIDANIDIYFKLCWVLAFQRYVCLPAKQLVFWSVLKQQGAELGLAGKDKISGFPLKILKKVDWFLTVPHLLHPRKRNPSPGHTAVPLHSVFLQALWGRAANSGNTSGWVRVMALTVTLPSAPGVSPLCLRRCQLQKEQLEQSMAEFHTSSTDGGLAEPGSVSDRDTNREHYSVFTCSASEVCSLQQLDHGVGWGLLPTVPC